MASDSLLAQLDGLNEQQLRRLLVEHLTKQKLGLYWEASAIERDAALNADIVLPRLHADWSCNLGHAPARNLVIEGDNFDSLRLLRATHRGKIRVIYIARPTTPATRTGSTMTATSAPTTAGAIRSGWTFIGG